MIIYVCPSDKKHQCSWEGASGDIWDHFIREHEDLLLMTNTLNFDLTTSSENYLLFHEEEIYLVQCRISDNVLRIFLRYLGPERIAQKLTFDIIVHFERELLEAGFISVSEEGCFQVKLSELYKSHQSTEFLRMTFNINGEFGQDSIRTTSLSRNSSTNSTKSTKSSKSTDDGVFTDEDFFPSLPHMPPRSKKLSFNESTKRRSCEDLQCIEDEMEPVGLSRSRTITYEEIKRRNVVRRTHSSLSLESIQEVELDINCTNCGNNLMAPPIYLCSSRHLFCAKCSSNNLCRVCQDKITEERDTQLEERLGRSLHPCKYKKNGCSSMHTYRDLSSHETLCKYCEYRCPIEECSFVGQFKAMHSHLRLIHSSVKIFESFIVVFQNNEEAFLLNEDKGIFYCHSKINADSVTWIAKFCGPKERRFFCELKFKEGKLKRPVLLSKIEDTYSVELSFIELKRDKLKAKNAILTITC